MCGAKLSVDAVPYFFRVVFLLLDLVSFNAVPRGTSRSARAVNPRPVAFASRPVRDRTRTPLVSGLPARDSVPAGKTGTRTRALRAAPRRCGVTAGPCLAVGIAPILCLGAHSACDRDHRGPQRPGM